MDVLEYFKAKKRMTNDCNLKCRDCPISINNNGHDLLCSKFEIKYPEEAEKIVERWIKENHKETFAERFKKNFGYDPGDICFRGSDCDCDCECDHCEWHRDAPYHVPEKKEENGTDRNSLGGKILSADYRRTTGGLSADYLESALMAASGRDDHRRDYDDSDF